MVWNEIINFHPNAANHNTDVMFYWKMKATELVFLSKLAEILHGVPATQVSVERTFSALNFIVSDRRNKLSTESINDVLMTRLNKNFVKV